MGVNFKQRELRANDLFCRHAAPPHVQAQALIGLEAVKNSGYAVVITEVRTFGGFLDYCAEFAVDPA
jgi:hypothetical protein